MDENIKNAIDRYYSGKIKKYGETPKGVDWNCQSSQILRFKQLLKICEHDKNYTINDLGCGYGALYQYMKENNFMPWFFHGYDISQHMIMKAKEKYESVSNCDFYHSNQLKKADYSVASGIFNVKLDFYIKDWEKYIFHTLKKMDEASLKGFSFNILTSYADKEYMRNDLYYADPTYFFDYCKTNFSKNIALLHDYDLFEFTILIRK